MTLTAKDIMVRDFDTINESASVASAIQMVLDGKVRATGHKTISIMVVNDARQLSGVVTMFDILYHLRPSFLNHGVDSAHLAWEGKLPQLIDEIKGKKIVQIMSAIVASALPDEHLMVVLDRMIKNKYRRLPVIEKGRPVGIVYLSDVYYHLFKPSPAR